MRLLSRRRVRSILDAPCGDFYWMKEVALCDIDYIGADIVEEIIARDRNVGDASLGCLGERAEQCHLARGMTAGAELGLDVIIVLFHQ